MPIEVYTFTTNAIMLKITGKPSNAYIERDHVSGRILIN